MIYIIAFVLSFIFTWQNIILSALQGNIVHLQNDRKPNAGASIIPAIPFFQIVFLSFAWLLNYFFHQFAIQIFCILFMVQFIFWIIAFKGQHKEFNELLKIFNQNQQ
ncbi:hypothetical protein [Acinetobacter sp. ANC5681]|jgi:hypothetical protein|uniref:hypothetical protein n=1 Tax=Acinetobacter sp. ANC5681 TaxID=2929504 RepID=UPI00201AADBF|nr:hypothetical protein [Acinetobacter sp. ANC5681]MCL5767871.1 hypothetical protein [Acinetobacter sp. ANC5681]